jgi:signal transduction histidine kinase
MSRQVKDPLPDADIRGWSEGRGHFVQPLAVALVSLLFAVLLFAMAMMDQRRLESALLDMLKKRASYVVEGIEKTAQDGYRRLTRVGDDYRNLYSGLTPVDEAFAIQEALAKALIALARYVDLQEQIKLMPHDRLNELAASEHLSAVALLDERGLIVFESGPVPPQVLSQANDLAEGRQEIAFRLFDRAGDATGSGIAGFVGIRREEGKGGVLLVLDGKGLQYWGLRISTQEAIEAMQWGTGLVYLAVEDDEGHLVAQSGSVPEEKVEECLLLAGSARDPDSPMSECVKVGNIKFLEVFLPFKMDGRVIGKARVGLETQETDELLIEKRHHIYLWTGLMVAVGFLAMGLLYRTQNRHISKLQTVRERLYQAERLSSLAKLGAEVAHEVRNPLNGISMAVQRLQREFAPAAVRPKQEEFEQITHNVRDEIRRINTIIEDFLSLPRSDRLDLRRHSLKDLVERIVFLIHEEVSARGIHIGKRWGQGSFSMLMDANKMEQALLNIVRNAVDSISDQGSILISLEYSGKSLISIKVRDTGAGIPEGEEQKIFEPHYTTKEKGSGLGLAIAREIILAHGGEIRVESRPDHGTTFEILLPGQEEKK